MTDKPWLHQSPRGRAGRRQDGPSTVPAREPFPTSWLAAPPDGGVSRREWLAVAGLTVVALVLRLYRLGELPPGLHIDEAYNILDARAVLAGWRPVFLPANAGRDVLYTYLQAPLLSWLGESAGTARLASAILGTLTVPAAWGFVRSLRAPSGSRVALVTAALTALSFWHLHFSRFGIRAVAFPLVVTLAMWAWWSTLANTAGADRFSRRALGRLVACGAFLGLAAYTHPAGRFLFVVPAVHASYLAVRTRTRLPLSAAAGAVIVAALVALPLASHWMLHPESFTGHASEVSVLDGGVGAVAANGLKVAGMFNVAGDPAGWRNLTRGRPLEDVLLRSGLAEGDAALVRGRPVFDLVTGLLFLGGIGALSIAAWAGRHWATLILVWLAALLVPTLVTDGAPNFSRAIGVIPAVFLAPALALDLLARTLDSRRGRAVGLALMAGVLLWGGLLTVRDYFVVWAGDPDTAIAFDAEKVALAQYVAGAHAEGTTVYLSPEMANHPTVLVSADVTPRGFDPAHGIVVADMDVSRTEYVFPTGDTAWAALETQLGNALVVESLGSRDGFRRAAEGTAGLAAVGVLDERFGVGRIDLGEDIPTEPVALRLKLAEPMARASGSVEVGGVARLVSTIVDTVVFVEEPLLTDASPVLTTTVTLVWLVMARSDSDLSAMVHLTTPDGREWGVGDGGPVGGSYPTTRWQPGEIVFDKHITVADPPPPPGEVQFVVGLYDWRTGERLTVHGPADMLRQGGTAAAVAKTTVIYD